MPDSSVSLLLGFSAILSVSLVSRVTARRLHDYVLSPPSSPLYPLITFRVSRRRREMYCGHAHLCVCLRVCQSAAACPHYCTDRDVFWGSGRGCPLVVHCWANLQSVHGGLRCYGNITRTLFIISLRPPRDMTT